MSLHAPMSDEQRELVPDVAAAVGGDGDFSGLRQDVAALKSGPWLPPPLLTVPAGLIVVIVEARKDRAPWVVQESLWEEYLPERKPAGRSEWRNATYALHAAGCLAGGLWLDVARQESFWHLPLWLFALDVVELLTNVATGPGCALPPDQLHALLQAQLVPVP